MRLLANRDIVKRIPFKFSMPLWLVFLSSCGSTPTENGTTSNQTEAVAISAENFREALILRDLDGQLIPSVSYENKTLILNLWATWCGPCIKEMPDLVEMEAALGGEFILLLASDEKRSKIKKFVDRKGHDLKYVQIENNLEALNVYSLPTTFIVGTDGQLKETLVGARDWMSDKQLAAIRAFAL